MDRGTDALGPGLQQLALAGDRFFIAPWTTLMWVIVAPGGVNGLDWLWVGLAIALDVATWSGGAKSGVDRRSGATA